MVRTLLLRTVCGLLPAGLARAQASGEVVIDWAWLPGDLDGPAGAWWALLAALLALLAPVVVRLRNRRKRRRTRITRIELEMPGHEIAAGVVYGVSADPPEQSADDVRPLARFRAKVFVAEPGGLERAADDGTRVRLTPRSEGVVASQAAVYVRGQAAAGEGTTLGGIIEGGVRCGPALLGAAEFPAAPADRWRVGPDGIEHLDAAAFVLEASTPGAGPSASVRFQIVAGRPALLELLLPDALPAHTLSQGLPPNGANFLDVSGVVYQSKRLALVWPPAPAQRRVQPHPTRFGAGGWVRASRRGPSDDDIVDLDLHHADGSACEPLPARIHSILGAATDAAGNPTPLAAKGEPGASVTLHLGAKSWRLIAQPFVIGEVPDVAQDATDVGWRCNAQPLVLPDNMFYLQFAAAFGAGVGRTSLAFQIADGHRSFGRWRYRLTDRPSSALVRWRDWFATGDVQDGWQFLGELGVGLIPFLSDGRDVLIYGVKRINGEPLEPIDHAVALLSLAGLALDLAPGNPIDVGAASAKSALKLLKRIPAEPAEALAKAIGEHLAKGLPKVDNASHWKDLVTRADFEKLAESVADLAKLGKAIKQLQTIKQAERLLTVLGAAVVVVQLKPLIELVAKYGYASVVDLLEGLEVMENP